jgi:hypothetical protein
MSELYPSLKPLKVEKPKRDEQKAWHPKGCVTVKSYERKLLEQAFKKGK